MKDFRLSLQNIYEKSIKMIMIITAFGFIITPWGREQEYHEENIQRKNALLAFFILKNPSFFCKRRVYNQLIQNEANQSFDCCPLLIRHCSWRGISDETWKGIAVGISPQQIARSPPFWYFRWKRWTFPL